MSKIIEYLQSHIGRESNLETQELLDFYEGFVHHLIGIHQEKEKNIEFKANNQPHTFKDTPSLIFSEIFHRIIANKKDHTNQVLEKFILINNNLFKSKDIPIGDLLDIYGGMKSIFHNLDSSYFSIASINELIIFSKIRLELFFKSLSIESLNSDFPLEYRIQMFNYHLGNYTKGLLGNKQFLDCMDFLILLFKNGVKEVKQGLLTAIIRINDIFVIISKAEVYNLYIEYGDNIEDSKRQWLEILMWFYPIKSEIIFYDTNYHNYQNIGLIANESFAEINKLSFGMNINSRENSKPEFDENKIGYTVIDFSIPLEVSEEFLEFEEGKVYFQRTNNFVQHPFYRKLTEVFISGNTIGHLLDIEIGKEFTLVKFVLEKSYHPEFDFISKTSVVNKEFEEEKALTGKIHLPTKLYIIRVLRKLYASNQIKGGFELKELNIDLFSFFQVSLISPNKKILFQRNYFQTSTKKFDYYTSRYHKRLNEMREFKNEFIDKFNGFKINNHSNLLSCISFLFHSVIEHNIRYKSGYKNFWRDKLCEKDPKTEPEVQPYLLNLIEFLCTLKGIGVVREPASGEGFIDMLFSYTTINGRLLKVCVEVKKAHHMDIVTAVDKQFKVYLDSQQTIFGIYLVLWFRYREKSKFNRPNNFENIENLKNEIDNNKPKEYEIETIILDCTKPISPSKIR